MMTIPFVELLRYEVANDDDYYALIQLYDERDDCYEEIIAFAQLLINKGHTSEDIDQLLLMQTDEDEIEHRILNIRKKHSKLIKRFNK